MADVTRSRLYRNQAQGGHWLQVDLVGITRNRHGLGAQIEIVAGDKRWVGQVQSGDGYASQVQPRLHFGLGPVDYVDTLRVVWPDGKVQVVEQIAVDQRLQLTYPLITSVSTHDAELPHALRLWSNYPTPSNGATVIRFDLPQPATVELAICNLVGQQVAVLVAEELSAGAHQINWDGRDGAGRALASGMDVYRLQTEDSVDTRKLLLVR